MTYGGKQTYIRRNTMMNQDDLEMMLGKEEKVAEEMKDFLRSHIKDLLKQMPNMTKAELDAYIERLMVV